MTKNEEGTGPVIRLLMSEKLILVLAVGEDANGELPTDVSLQLSQLRVKVFNTSVVLNQDGRTPSKSLLLQETTNCNKRDVLSVVDANMLFRGPVKVLLSRLRTI